MQGIHAVVTGGAGFVGSNLALELERRGARVTVVDDFTTGHFENLRGFGGVVLASKTEAPDWPDRLPSRPDALFHLASITDTTVQDQARMMSNVEGLRVALELARRSSIPLVFASSAAVYGKARVPMREEDPPDPANIYGFSKRAMETLAAEYRRQGVRAIGLRYFNVYGPGEDHKGSACSMVGQLARQMLAGKAPRIFRNGEQGRDWIHVRDVVEATLLAWHRPELEIVNVGTGVETTFNQMISYLNEGLGTSFRPEYFDNPYTAFYQDHTRADSNRLVEGMGFRPRLAPRDGMIDYARELRHRGGGAKLGP
jgi:ADP-L-glycero-D-manno-heptose 6-epimerase